MILQWNSACFLTAQTTRGFRDPDDNVTIINGMYGFFNKAVVLVRIYIKQVNWLI